MSRILKSPPTREAWIEISGKLNQNQLNQGRLPPGRRGLKLKGLKAMEIWKKSPPTREAWIEITPSPTRAGMSAVASHPGGVD